MKIRWRLAWYGVGLTAAVLLLFSILIATLVVGTAGDDQDKLLSSSADASVAALAQTDVGAADPGEPLFLPDATTSDQPFTTVYDDVGQPIYGTATVGGELLPMPAAAVVEALDTGSSEVTSSEMRSQVRKWIDSVGTVGVVAASQPARVIDQQIEGVRGFLFVFALIALIATLIGAWFMSGRAMRPIKTLAKTTDEIGQTGDLSQRLDPVERNDEIGALTSSFNSMLDSIERATRDRDLTIESQKRFIADASHELRSPLTSILANSGFLIEKPGADADDRLDATEDIRTEATRMSGLVDRLLTLARADVDGVAAIDPGPVELDGLVGSVARRARNLAIEVTTDVPAGIVVWADSTALAEVLWILVDNADRHGGDHVSIAATTTDVGAVITVADDGAGIPEAEMSRVFERFHRADISRTGTGYGLGLAIARSIMVNHGGSIGVENAADHGAVFTMTLPLG